jgi:hypothetical protein
MSALDLSSLLSKLYASDASVLPDDICIEIGEYAFDPSLARLADVVASVDPTLRLIMSAKSCIPGPGRRGFISVTFAVDSDEVPYAHACTDRHYLETLEITRAYGTIDDIHTAIATSAMSRDFARLFGVPVADLFPGGTCEGELRRLIGLDDPSI